MKYPSIVLTLFLTFQLFAQQSNDSINNIKPINTIDLQFNTLYKKSGSYQIYKVVLKTAFRELQASAVDSIDTLTKKIREKNATIDQQIGTIAGLQKTAQDTNTQLNNSLEKENSISLFGMQLTKGSYSFILFAIIFILLVLLLYVLYKYKNSHELTKKAKYTQEDVELEFTIFRKKSIEREQKIRRELQDLIIKNRDS
ncbi:MAG: hypothetical protein JKZ00_05460 [Flavobacteriaceae bacterium]|nr:hypothetical protein [Flavobacteriaceae bacterium]